jgi:hypothetical protein
MTELGRLRRGTPGQRAVFRSRIKTALRVGRTLAGAALLLGVSKASLKVYLAEDPVLQGVERPGRGRPKTSPGKESAGDRKKRLDGKG